MVGTNWGGGQSPCVLLKSCASLEVKGADAVAQASLGLMRAATAFRGLPAGREAKLNGCSSHLRHFSPDKFLHPSPSDLAGRGVGVCVEGAVALQQPQQMQKQCLGFTSALLC